MYTNIYAFLRVVIYNSFDNTILETLIAFRTQIIVVALFFRGWRKYAYIFYLHTLYVLSHTPNGGLRLANAVVTTELMFSYSFTRVNDEFYEGRGHKLSSRTDGRCNSLRRWMATGDGGNRDRPYTCKAKLNSCLVFAIKSASHRVERQFF